MQNTASSIAEIAEATVHQAARAEDVAVSIRDMAKVTEASAAGSQQMAASSEQLTAGSSSLREVVGQFNTGNQEA